MEAIGHHVYFFAPAWLVGLLCCAIASANIYLSYRKRTKAWAKRLKAVNWLFMGGVYFYIAFWTYSNTEVRLLIRISIAFLIAGEAAYQLDTFQDMADSALVLVKRLVKHG